VERGQVLLRIPVLEKRDRGPAMQSGENITFRERMRGLSAPLFLRAGFSMVELLVVIAIIGILAIGVATMSRNQIVDVKGAIFNLRSDLSFARTEAVRRNSPILIEFDMANDGYAICDDTNANNSCGDEVGADIVKTVAFNNVVRFYDIAVGAPAGPDVSASGEANIWPDPGGGDTDGVTFPEPGGGDDFVTMLADGSCSENGTVLLYSPTPGDGGASLRWPPIALIVNQSGVMQIRRWRPAGSAWESK